MGQLTAQDNYQQDTQNRNLELSRLMGGAWNSEVISNIERIPKPTNPPDSQGPKQGTWVAETVDKTSRKSAVRLD
jgi:hypothetical protein